MENTWTMSELRRCLAEFKRDLQSAGLAANTVHTYVDRSERFLRYLAGEYQPGG
jgi:hypothetical protein